MGRQHQKMDRPGVQQVPEGSGEQGKMEKTVMYVCVHIMFRVHEPIMKQEGSINFIRLLLLRYRSIQKRTDTRQGHMRKSR